MRERPGRGRGQTHEAVAVAVALLAAVSIGAGAQVTLLPVGTPEPVAPPSVVTLVFRLESTATTPVRVELDATLPLGWSLLSLPGAVDLAASGSEIVLVTAHAPIGTPAGSYDVELTATDEAPPGESVQASHIVSVVVVRAIELHPDPREASAPPGGVATFTLHVSNRGNEPTEIMVTPSSTWSAVPLPASAWLAIGGEATVRVSHHVPRDAMPGDRGPLAVAVLLPDGTREWVSLLTVVELPDDPTQAMLAPEWLSGSLELRAARDPHQRTARSLAQLELSGTGFGAAGSVSSLFGPAPVALDSFHVSLTQPGALGAIGDVSRLVSPIFLVSCRGGRFEATAGPFNAALLAGWRDEQARMAGALGIDVAGFAGVLSYIEWRSEDERRTAWSTSMNADPFPGCSVAVEAARSSGGYLTSSGWLSGATLAVGPYTVEGEIYRIGPTLPTPRAGRGGAALHQSLAFPTFTLHSDAVRESLLGDDGRPASRSQWIDLGLTARVPAVELRLLADAGWRRNTDLDAPDEAAAVRSLELEVAGSGPRYPFSLGGALHDTTTLSTHVTRLDLRQRLGANFESVSLLVSLLQERRFDQLLGLWSRDRDEATLELALGPEITLELAYLHRMDEHELAASCDLPIAGFARIHLEGRVAWSIALETDAAFGWSIGVAVDVEQIPFLFLATRGRLEGTVFVDANQTGERDPGEIGVAETTVSAGPVTTTTDAGGRFRMAPLAPGETAIDLPLLPAEYVPLVLLPIVASIVPGDTAVLQIPLARAASVEGRLTADAPGAEGDAAALPPPDAGGVDGGIPGVTVRLGGAAFTQAAVSAVDGRFRFDRLAPGDYTLEVDASTLPSHHELRQASWSITLVQGESGSVDIPVSVRSRTLQWIEDAELEIQVDGNS